jgi:hypothetical protein
VGDGSNGGSLGFRACDFLLSSNEDVEDARKDVGGRGGKEE